MAGNVPPLTSTLPVPLAKYVPTVTAEMAAGAATPLVKPRTVHTTAPLPKSITNCPLREGSGLATGNPEAEEDRALLAELGLKTKQHVKAEVTV